MTYGVDVTFGPLAGWVLWEFNATCQPGQAHLVLEEACRVLESIRTSGFTDDEIARARLSEVKRLISDFRDQDDGFQLLEFFGRFGGAPEDLLEQVASRDAGPLRSMAASALDPHRFAFTATGPMFEEDIDQFEVD